MTYVNEESLEIGRRISGLGYYGFRLTLNVVGISISNFIVLSSHVNTMLY